MGEKKIQKQYNYINVSFFFLDCLVEFLFVMTDLHVVLLWVCKYL